MLSFSCVCVCVILPIHHVCASTWCLTWYQSGRLLALLQIEWAICIYGLCISTKILDIFAALRVSAAVFLPPFRSFLKRSSIQNPSIQKLAAFQHWFWKKKKSSTAHLKVDFFLQFLPIKFCILKSCWKLFKLNFWRNFWFLMENNSEFCWRFHHPCNFLLLYGPLQFFEKKFWFF